MPPKTVQDWLKAVSNGDVKYVTANLNKYKGSTDADGNTGLMLAVIAENEQIVSLLLKHEAGRVNKMRLTALAFAVMKEKTKMIQLLAPAEARVPLEKDRTALMLAAEQGHSETVALLVPYSALDGRDVDGLSALDYSTLHNDTKSLTAMLSGGKPSLDTIDVAIRHALQRNVTGAYGILKEHRDRLYPEAQLSDSVPQLVTGKDSEFTSSEVVANPHSTLPIKTRQAFDMSESRMRTPRDDEDAELNLQKSRTLPGSRHPTSAPSDIMNRLGTTGPSVVESGAVPEPVPVSISTALSSSGTTQRAELEPTDPAQLQALLKTKQKALDTLQMQNNALNTELVDTKRRLNRAELSARSRSNAQATSAGGKHWASVSEVEQTNKVMADLQQQIKELKNDSLKNKVAYDREKQRLQKQLDERASTIADLEKRNGDLQRNYTRAKTEADDLRGVVDRQARLREKDAQERIDPQTIVDKDEEIERLGTLVKDLEAQLEMARSELTPRQNSSPQNAYRASEPGDRRSPSPSRYDPTNVSRLVTPTHSMRQASIRNGVQRSQLGAGSRQITVMENDYNALLADNTQKEIKLAEARAELARVTGDSEVSDLSRAQRSIALSCRGSDLEKRYNALLADNERANERLRERTVELEQLIAEVEASLEDTTTGTSADLSKLRAIISSKNREIRELKEKIAAEESRHANTCRTLNGENERLTALCRRREADLKRVRTEATDMHHFKNESDDVRAENSALLKELKLMRTELDRRDNIYPELAKYEDLVKTLGEENDAMKKMLKKRKEQLEYLLAGGDPSKLETVGGALGEDTKRAISRGGLALSRSRSRNAAGGGLAGSQALGSSKLRGPGRTGPEHNHSDLIERDAQGNDPKIITKLTDELNEYERRVTELSRLVAMRDAEIVNIRKQAVDGPSYSDLLTLLNEKMTRVDQLSNQLEQKEREIQRLISTSVASTPISGGRVARTMTTKGSAATRFYNQDEVKEILSQLAEKESQLAMLQTDMLDRSVERMKAMGDKYTVVRVEQLEDRVAQMTADLADRDATVARLRTELRDAEIALKHMTGETGNVPLPNDSRLQEQLAESKIRAADMQQELEWAQVHMNSMADDLSRYRDMISRMSQQPSLAVSGTSDASLVASPPTQGQRDMSIASPTRSYASDRYPALKPKHRVK